MKRIVSGEQRCTVLAGVPGLWETPLPETPVLNFSSLMFLLK